MTATAFFFTALRGTPPTQRFSKRFANPFQIRDGITVGYNSNDLNAGGAKMKAAPFLTIGSEGARISQLIPKGYLNNQDLKDSEETRGEFCIQLLTKRGGADKTYKWVHTYDVEGEEWRNDGHWETPNGDEIVAGDENDYLFKTGNGLWTGAADVSSEDEDAEYGFQSSGQVTQDSVKLVLNPGGAAAKGNPFAVPLHISALIPAGYQNNQDLKDSEETRGEFCIQLLTKRGGADKTYKWVHTYDVEGEEWRNDGHWETPTGDEIVAGDENDYEIKVGEGLWIGAADVSSEDEDAEYSITVNCPVKF